MTESSITRRRLLGAAAAAPVLGLRSAMAAPHQDQALLDLVPAVLRLRREWETARSAFADAESKARAKAAEELGPAPTVFGFEPGPTPPEHLDMTLRELREKAARPDPDVEAARAAHERARTEWKDGWSKIRGRFELDRLARLSEKAAIRYREGKATALGMRASTFEGLQAKALLSEEGSDLAGASIVADLLAMRWNGRGPLGEVSHAT